MGLKSLVDYRNPRSFGNRLRRKRAELLKTLIDHAFEQYGQCRILDVGGTHDYWSIFPADWLAQRKVSVLLLNIDVIPVPAGQTMFTSVAGDACRMPQFADNEFELVH